MIGEEATRIGDEGRMEITADEVALEGGAGFEAEGVFEGVSEAVEEGMVGGGKRNDFIYGGGTESLFNRQWNKFLFVYIEHFEQTYYLRQPINAVLHVHRPSIGRYMDEIHTSLPFLSRERPIIRPEGGK